jgi:hypothetical protein
LEIVERRMSTGLNEFRVQGPMPSLEEGGIREKLAEGVSYQVRGPGFKQQLTFGYNASSAE